MLILEDDSLDRVADWIELTLVLNEDGTEFISKGSLSRLVEAQGRTPDEAYLSDIFQVLNNRQNRYIERYFEVKENSIQRALQGEPPVEYVFCLLLSLYGARGGGIKTKLFERLACCAINKHMEQAYVFGWPYDAVDEGNYNSRIEAATKNMANRIGERFVKPPEPYYKDAGIDVVAWKPFIDNRSGQLILLVQCAAGHNLWDKKQIPAKRWNQYIHFSTDPNLGFAFPKALTAEDVWHNNSCDYGLLFDRIRIVNLLNDGLIETGLKKELSDCLGQELSLQRE